MSLDAGNKDATAGMAKLIYDEMVRVVEPELRADLAKAGLSDAQIKAAVEATRKSWTRQGYTVASGVIKGLRESDLLLFAAKLKAALDLPGVVDVASLKKAIAEDKTTRKEDIT